MTTTPDDVWRLLAELIEAQKETERILKEKSLETDRPSTSKIDRPFTSKTDLPFSVGWVEARNPTKS